MENNIFENHVILINISKYLEMGDLLSLKGITKKGGIIIEKEITKRLLQIKDCNKLHFYTIAYPQLKEEILNILRSIKELTIICNINQTIEDSGYFIRYMCGDLEDMKSKINMINAEYVDIPQYHLYTSYTVFKTPEAPNKEEEKRGFGYSKLRCKRGNELDLSPYACHVERLADDDVKGINLFE